MKKNNKPYNLYEIDKLIRSRKLVLPAWQREFVWRTTQIEKIFDSIYHGFPIGNILVWNTSLNADVFYEFITNINYISTKNADANSKPINQSTKDKTQAVLDGQQRLTSLINVLFYDNIKIKNKKYSLFYNVKSETFKFFEDKKIIAGEKIKRNYPTENDYKVKDIYESNFDIKNIPNKERLLINNLKEKLQNFSIGYDLYDGDLNNALEVFRRLNTGGTKLTNPEINVSIIINNSKKYNINFRDEITTKIDAIKSKYNIDLNLAFFVKAIVVCILDEVKYDENKVQKEIDKIIKNYSKVFDAIEKVCSYCDSTLNVSYILKSKNILVPLVYYYYKYGNFGQGLSKGIKYYISVSSIMGVFGGQSDNVITYMKKYVDKYQKESFDIKNIKKIEIKHVSYKINTQNINKMLNNEYQAESTSMILYLIYSYLNPSFVYNNKIRQDHMYPKKMFDKVDYLDTKSKKYKELISYGLSKSRIKRIIKNRLWNKISNLQVLNSNANGIDEKWDKQFIEWINEDKNHIDDTMPNIKKVSYELKNFMGFYKNRKQILTKILKDVFK